MSATGARIVVALALAGGVAMACSLLIDTGDLAGGGIVGGTAIDGTMLVDGGEAEAPSASYNDIADARLVSQPLTQRTKAKAPRRTAKHRMPRRCVSALRRANDAA